MVFCCCCCQKQYSPWTYIVHGMCRLCLSLVSVHCSAIGFGLSLTSIRLRVHCSAIGLSLLLS